MSCIIRLIYFWIQLTKLSRIIICKEGILIDKMGNGWTKSLWRTRKKIQEKRCILGNGAAKHFSYSMFVVRVIVFGDVLFGVSCECCQIGIVLRDLNDWRRDT